MGEKERGRLVIIGGAEDKTGGGAILEQAAALIGREGPLTILTTATEKPEEVGCKYVAAFEKLGVQNVSTLHISTRGEANSPDYADRLMDARGVFMTGGDQLRITSILGGTRAGGRLRGVYDSGGVVMGTSAGASAMSATMIISGDDNEPAKKCTLKMAPGLGLIGGVIIDQHFDQRGRFGRLLCGVAENPDIIGIGIDEDTAITVYPDMHFEVVGTNAVTVIDGRAIEASNVSELRPEEILAVVGVRVDVLPQGYGYELNNRKVIRLKYDEGKPD